MIGVILTGTLDDGTAGLLAVKHRNGMAVVQDPQDALYPGMPQSALEHVQVDYCVPLSEIGPLLRRLVTLPAAEEQASPVPPEMEQEVRIAEMETNRLNEHEQIGKPSAFSCPECHGVLWEIQDGDLLRFRCRTGHAFSPESVIAEQSEELERALWYALKTLEEKVSLSRRLVQRAQARGQALLAQSFEAKMQEAEEHAALLRHMLTKDDPAGAS